MAGGRDFEVIKRLRPEPLTEREKECLKKLDIVDYEIFRHKMELIILEAKEAFTKIGAAPLIRGGDVSVGIYTAQGDLSMSAPGVWIHSVLQQIPIKHAPTLAFVSRVCILGSLTMFSIMVMMSLLSWKFSPIFIGGRCMPSS